MIVNYKKAGVWIIQHGTMVNSVKDAEGKSTQKTVFSGQHIRIIPGLNTIRDSVWSDISQYEDVKRKLESGMLEVIEDNDKAHSGKKVNDSSAPAATPNADIESLAKYDQKKAISVVQGTMEASALASWKTKEKRPMVLKAIKDQLEVVSKADKVLQGKD